MHYLGGKARIGGEIAGVINALLGGRPYYEPFVGAAWVMCRVEAEYRLASDVHEDLILLWQALQQGWMPPENLSEEDYERLWHSPPSPLRGFAGFGCSFSGKWFGGYARSGTRNYARNAKNSLMKKVPGIRGVNFFCMDYRDVVLDSEWVVYCDPPYSGTTKYSMGFDHEVFWNKMREWSEGNVVLISEYSAPNDFDCIREWQTRTDMHNSNRSNARTEKLFVYKGN